jgi:hypothetical protein
MNHSARQHTLGEAMTDTESAVDVARVRAAPHFSWKSFGVANGIVFILLAAFLVPYFFSMEKNTLAAIMFGVAGAAFSAIFYTSLFYFPIMWIRRSIFRAEQKVDHLTKSSEDLQGALEQDFVTNLVRINFKYIDAYYLQTRIQADKSFTVTVVAAVVSLILILVGIALMYIGGISATPATTAGTTSTVSIAASLAGGQATAAATLSAAAGILGQFISAVFFYLYNQTVAKMADYHRKLVFTQNIGLALKISDGLPVEEKTKAQLALIETLSKDINKYLSS